MDKKDYTCSAWYTQKEYALTACPTSKAKCGSYKEVTFDEAGNKTTLQIFNLTEGETCSYKLNAECGSPYFKVDDFRNQDDSALQVSFIEYDWSKANKY